MSERNLRGRKTWKQPRTDWLGTSTQPSLPAQLESPREFQQMHLVSHTHSCVETKSQNLNFAFLMVFISKRPVETLVRSFVIFGRLVLTVSDLLSCGNQ